MTSDEDERKNGSQVTDNNGQSLETSAKSGPAAKRTTARKPRIAESKPAKNAATAKAADASGAKAGTAEASSGASAPAPKTAAKASAKSRTTPAKARGGAAAKADGGAKSAAPTRVRAGTPADTRTATRKVPAKKAAPAAEVAAVDAAPTPQAATPQSAPPAAPQKEVAPKVATPKEAASGFDAFAEAAFGPESTIPEQLVQNIERIEALTQRLMSAISKKRAPNPGVEAPGPDLFASATAAWLKMMAEQPAKIIGQQVSYWGETLQHFAETQSALTKGQLTAAPDEEQPKDRRFSNPLWETHPFFSFVKRQYQINANALQQAASDLDIEDMTDRRRIDWFTRQIIDMMAPTNFLATNPDALEKAIATEGESLVKGLENLVSDVEHNGGELIVSLSDRNAFRVGENIGTTEGTVVARAPLFELIQYKPTTEKVHALPLVIFPPWINKFYILDLKPQNSLIKWIVDQGFTLFVVAWKNPDVSYADTGMDDYVSAYLDIMNRVQDITGEDKMNAIGYCIAGTTLSLTLALMKQRGDERVNTATFFTTLTDFAEQGEFTAYLQDDFVGGIEDEVKSRGILSSQLMTRTFSFLRANDLIWGPAIRSYMLGESPPAFDLLFWNGDGTNLPGRMAMEYLRGLCQKNAFATDGYTVLGENVRLSDVTLPVCAIACETDHIAPWKDSWRGVSQMGSKDKQFILSESGHIAGIVNPPSKKKYGHYTSDAGFADGHDTWLEQASFHPGSWWGRWAEWLASNSGPMVPARDPGTGLGPAPGHYVHERPAA